MPLFLLLPVVDGADRRAIAADEYDRRHSRQQHEAQQHRPGHEHRGQCARRQLARQASTVLSILNAPLNRPFFSWGT